jgi:DNA polymerase-3 subunit epsilon
MNAQEVAQCINDLTFTAFDVETANHTRESVCSIGIVSYEKGNMVYKNNFIVCPREIEFSPINSSIHRIDHNTIMNSSSITEVWRTVRELFESKPVFAHNAQFDIQCLRKSLDSWNAQHKEVKYGCTIKLANHAFPDLDDYRLNDVAKYMQITHNHHNSLSDATIAAEIALRAIPLIPEHQFDYHADELTNKLFKASSKNKRSNQLFTVKEYDRKLLQPKASDETTPFTLKRVVVTGDIHGYTRQEVFERLHELGADINTSISKKTDIVIIGANPGPKKIEKINTLISSGVNIEIIEEEELFKWIKK